VEDEEQQDRPAPERVLPHRPDHPLPGLAGEDHQVREARVPPERLGEPQRDLLEPAESEPGDGRAPVGRQTGGEARLAPLEYAQRHRYQRVRTHLDRPVVGHHPDAVRPGHDLGHGPAQPDSDP
jgi:hypothetical protein